LEQQVHLRVFLVLRLVFRRKDVDPPNAVGPSLSYWTGAEDPVPARLSSAAAPPAPAPPVRDDGVTLLGPQPGEAAPLAPPATGVPAVSKRNGGAPPAPPAASAAALNLADIGAYSGPFPSAEFMVFFV
jgi:hypothetical protein